MAQEITLSASLAYSDSEGTSDSLAVSALQVSVTTKRVTKLKQNVGITEEPINLGDVSSVGFVMFVNRDATNFIQIKTSSGGIICGKLLPGESYGPARLASGMQGPYAIADTAPCQMDVFVISS